MATWRAGRTGALGAGIAAGALALASAASGCFALDWGYSAAPGGDGGGGAAATSGTAGTGGGGGNTGCPAGTADCDGKPNNGCEVDLTTDPASCGACGRACSDDGALAPPACAGGLCQAACQLGLGDCVSPAAPSPDDGCETKVDTDTACGGCGNSCVALGLVCDGQVDQQNFECECTSEADCGSFSNCQAGTGLCKCAGVECGDSEICMPNGFGCSCLGGPSCGAGMNCCANPPGCVNIQTDPGSCGACGHACPAGWACAAGVCTAP